MPINPFVEETDYQPLKLEPLRIIKKPYKDKTTRQWCIHLSNGQVVNDKELAAILGIKQQSVWSRFDNLPWDHPDVMHVGRRPKGKHKRNVVDLSHIERGKYAGLSDKPRCIWKYYQPKIQKDKKQ